MKALLWIIILILIVGGIYWVLNRDNSIITVNNTTNNITSTTTSPNTNATSTATTTASGKTVTVIYGATGFSPSTVNINKGDTVKFINQSSSNMWVGADSHPTHMAYDGTSLTQHCGAQRESGLKPFDSCKNVANSGSYSFTFVKTGSWEYHNHSSAAHGGTVVVK